MYDPKGLAILTPLIVGLSKLKQHKFNYNFRETVDPMCLINDEIEDTEHFLLHVIRIVNNGVISVVRLARYFNYIASQIYQIILLCELCYMVMKDLRITRIDKS